MLMEFGPRALVIIIYYDEGDVGIGTDSPAETLDVSGTTILRANCLMQVKCPGMAGYLLESTGSGINWIPQHHVDGIWTGDNIYYDDGDGTVSIGTTESSGNLYIAKSDPSDNYGPAAYPPNLYLRAEKLPTLAKLNSPAVLKFSAQYSVLSGDCAPAYIWHGYRAGSTPAEDSTDGRLCITANGYTSFILDGYNGYVGIGNKGQVLQGGNGTLIPTQL